MTSTLTKTLSSPARTKSRRQRPNGQVEKRMSTQMGLEAPQSDLSPNLDPMTQAEMETILEALRQSQRHSRPRARWITLKNGRQAIFSVESGEVLVSFRYKKHPGGESKGKP